MLKKIRKYLTYQSKDDGRYNGHSIMLKLLAEEMKELKSKRLKKIDISHAEHINYNIRFCK